MKHYFSEVVAVRRGVVCWVVLKLRYLISKKMQQDPWERKLSPGPVFAQTIAHHTQSKGQKFDGPLPSSPPPPHKKMKVCSLGKENWECNLSTRISQGHLYQIWCSLPFN